MWSIILLVTFNSRIWSSFIQLLHFVKQITCVAYSWISSSVLLFMSSILYVICEWRHTSFFIQCHLSGVFKLNGKREKKKWNDTWKLSFFLSILFPPINTFYYQHIEFKNEKETNKEKSKQKYIFFQLQTCPSSIFFSCVYTSYLITRLLKTQEL